MARVCGNTREVAYWTMYKTWHADILDATFFRSWCLMYKYISGSEEFGLVFRRLFLSPLSSQVSKELKHPRRYTVSS